MGAACCFKKLNVRVFVHAKTAASMSSDVNLLSQAVINTRFFEACSTAILLEGDKVSTGVFVVQVLYVNLHGTRDLIGSCFLILSSAIRNAFICQKSLAVQAVLMIRGHNDINTEHSLSCNFFFFFFI